MIRFHIFFLPPVHSCPADDSEALRLSREQDKPIFLSIGYSTCHWCHVTAGKTRTARARRAIFYVWALEELEGILAKPDLELVRQGYGVTPTEEPRDAYILALCPGFDP